MARLEGMAAGMTAAPHPTLENEIEAGLCHLGSIMEAEGAAVAISESAARGLSAAVADWRPSLPPADLIALPSPRPAAAWHLEHLLSAGSHDAVGRAKRVFHARLLGFLLAPDRPQFRPLVTILIPVYNRAALCAEAVQSCLAQSWQSLEILVVDDGSTDDLVSALQPFGDRVRLLRKPNGGVSSARNAGIAAARGDFVQFLDSDNLLLPGAIALKVEGFAAIADADLCYSKAVIEHATGRSYDPRREPDGTRRCATRGLLPAVARNYPFFVSTAMIARWVAWDGVKFEEDLPRYEDLRYWVALALRGTKVIGIARALTVRRVLRQSLTGLGHLSLEPPLTARARNLRDTLASPDCWHYAASFYRQLLGQHLKAPIAAEPTEFLKQAIEELCEAIHHLENAAGLSWLPVLAQFREQHGRHMRDSRAVGRRDPCSRLIAGLGDSVTEAIRRAPRLRRRDVEFWLEADRPSPEQAAIRKFLVALGPWKHGVRRRCTTATTLLRHLSHVPTPRDVARYRRIRFWLGATIARLVLQFSPATSSVPRDPRR